MLFKLYPAVSVKQFLSLFDMTPLLELLGSFYFKAYTSVGHLLASWILDSPVTFLTLNLPSIYLRHTLKHHQERPSKWQHKDTCYAITCYKTLHWCPLRAANSNLGLMLTPAKTNCRFIAMAMPSLFPFCQTIFFSNITFNLTPHVLKRIADFLLIF